MTDTGSIPAVRTGGFPTARTGGFPAVRTGSFPKVNGTPRPSGAETPFSRENRTGKTGQRTQAASAASSFSALRRSRKHREQIFQLVLTGTAVFLLLFCLTGVSAYATVSSALQQTGGSTPLPESYAIAPIAAPASDALQAASSSLELSEEDYQNRLLIPAGFTGGENEASVPEPPPQDEDGRYILAGSALPETYTVTVETEAGVFVYKTYTKTEEIAYKTVYKDTRELAKGKEVVQTEGHSGSTSYTIKETYKDGVLQEKEVVEKNVTRSVQDRVILRGVGQAVTGSDGKSYAYKSQLSMKAYCYYKGETGGTHSATGKELRYGMIAVDPRVIPLGTRVYIDAPGTAFDGVFVAEDTGGAIKGNIIDVYMETRAKALSFGTQSVKVYILE